MRSVLVSIALVLVALGLLGLTPAQARAYYYYYYTPAYYYYPAYPATAWYPAAYTYYYTPYYYTPYYYTPPATVAYYYTPPSTVAYSYTPATTVASAVAGAASSGGWTSFYYAGTAAPASESRAPAGSVVNLVVGDNYYQPLGLTIPRGTVVRWVNRGLSEHTVTSTTGKWNSVTLAPGETTLIEFVTPGTYPYRGFAATKGGIDKGVPLAEDGLR
jgi:plastocyanin